MLKKPILIAGPCMAESQEVVQEVAAQLTPFAREHGFDYVFKASFDKANRTSITSFRGPGLQNASSWFEDIRRTHEVATLTDIHLPEQAAMAAEVCDILQIPAFLCRQTDLIQAAAKTGKVVNIKKGQFLAPGAMAEVCAKLRQVWQHTQNTSTAWLTERGCFFGYGDLVVDFRSLATMKKNGFPVIFDVTHSTQSPASTSSNQVSGARRSVAPLLARAAIATGYCDGVFMEVHPNPSKAQSDAAAQLSIPQAKQLLKQLQQLWQTSALMAVDDYHFQDG
ncbi:MAG: 3-deoxy-8-phosphooctulonate synthase [Zetaproteobacteria bacterium]|nr:3-deoxy-8-phosphooctulonate synthase [Zetaproteobacteria bacterium]